MNFKTTLILAIVFIVLLAAVLFMNKEQAKKDEIKEEAKKLLNLKKEDVTEIFLSANNIHAVKEDDQWKITSPVETDGDKSAIEGVLGMFNWAKIERTISHDTSEFANFGLEPPIAEMILVHKDGKDTLFVGDKTPTGSFVFARKGSEVKVFLTTTTLKTNAEKKLFDLRNKKVLGFEKNNVQSFNLKNESGDFTISKRGAEWKLDEPIDFGADKTKIDQVLNGVNNANAKEFVDEDPENLSTYCLSKPKIQIDVFLGENKARKSLFIGKMKEDKYYAKDDSRRPVFLVDSSFVSKLSVTLFDLRNKNVANFSTSDVDSFSLIYIDSTITCAKDTAGDWQVIAPEFRKAKSWKVSGITSAVSNLRVDEFVDDNPTNLRKYGLDNPTIKARFFKDGKIVRELLVGKKSEEMVYVKTDDLKSVYLAKKNLLEQLTPKLDDLAEKKQEPKTVETENQETN